MFKNITKNFEPGVRELKKNMKIAEEIDSLGDNMSKLTDEELQSKTSEFKNRLAEGSTLDDILVEAFAVAREAALRVMGQYPYMTQLLGGLSIHGGNIAEMKTGEGKTLMAVLPAYLNALSGKGVHIITVNEYLAGREAEGEIGDLFRFLGLTVALNNRELSKEEKKEAYKADILYSTNNEVGFDYLRDNMVLYQEQKVQRPLNFAIIDEVDSILVDEARTPLIISGGSKNTANLYMVADRFVKSLRKEVHYDMDEKTRAVTLTDEGVIKAEQSLNLDNLYDLKYSALVHHIQQSLKANFVMRNEVDYVVKEGKIVIVDQFTGRMQQGRAFSDGLHQALEVKEGLEIRQETRTLATITYQNLFRMYNKLSGMTGTAKTEEEEFRNIYNMYVVEIPTNKPVIRDDRPDLIYIDLKSKYKAIADEIELRHKAGQPILVGTIAIETSELISMYLKKRGIKHEVLNAKNHSREAEIVANAGEIGAVTIATNMAGRGTDIKLAEGVIELGGLCVIGTERHESRRIDNQLRGRSGRQGDPGFSQFYISMEDELMVRFGSDNIQGILQRTPLAEGEAIQSGILSRAIESSQKKVEGSNYDVRKQLLQYDDVIRQQREVIYEQRDVVLVNEDLHNHIIEMVKNVAKQVVMGHFVEEVDTTDENIENVVNIVNNDMLKSPEFTVDMIKGKTISEIEETIIEFVLIKIEEKKSTFEVNMFAEFEKVVMLRVIDTKWMEHIDTMSHLREGIHLRSYAQENPLRSYTMEGFQLFDEMMNAVERDIVKYVMKAEIRDNLKREEVEKGQAVQNKDKTKKRVPRVSKKVGRNDPCPCGSGKKYKQCCGR